MAGSRIDLILSSNSSQFRQDLSASQKEVEHTTESLKELQQQGEEFSHLTQSLHHTTEEIYHLAHTTEVVTGLLDTLTQSKVGVIKAASHMAESMASAAITIGLVVDATSVLSTALDGVVKGVYEGLHAVESFVHELESDPFIKAAGEAQDYEAQMAALTGSVKVAREELAKMYAYAAQTSFNVNSIVAAGIQLKSFGKDIERFLPIATALASVSGQDVPSAATALGEALSGIGGGLTRLSQTFRLSKKELAAFGAELNSQRDIVTDTIGQQEKLALAIEKGVRFKFGDIINQQINTIEGAFHRFHDVAEQIRQQLGGAFRQSTINTVKSITEIGVVILGVLPALTELTGILNDVSQDAMEGFTVAAKFAGGVILGMTTGVLLLNPQLIALGAVVGTVGLGIKKLNDATNGALGGFTAFGLAMTAVATGLTVFAGAFAAPIVGLGLLTIAAGVAAVAIGNMIGPSNLAGRSLIFLGTAAQASGKSLITTLAIAASSFIGLGVVVAAATIGLLAFYKVQGEVTAANKAAEEQNNKLSESYRRGIKHYGKSAQELLKTGVSAREVALSIGGLQQKLNDLENTYENQDERQIRLAELFGFSSKAFRTHSKEVQQQIDDTKRLIQAEQEGHKKLAQLETDNKTSAPEAIKEAQAIAEEFIKFEQKKSKGVYATKQEQFKALDELHTRSKETYERLEKLKEQIENDPDKDSQENKDRLAKLEAYSNEAKARNKINDLAIIDSKRDAVNEQVSIVKEGLEREVSFGRKSHAEQIAGLKRLAQETLQDDKERGVNFLAERKALNQQIEDLEIQSQEEIKNAVIATQEAEKGAIDDKLSKIKEEFAFGQNLLKLSQDQQNLIKSRASAEISLIQQKLALQNSRQGDPQIRAENEKQANAAIHHIRVQENADLRAAKKEYGDYAAAQIQINKDLISSQKELLQSKLDSLTRKFTKGADNQGEINSARAIIRAKEVDEIRSEEKARLLTEKNVDRIKQIKIDTQNKISEHRRKAEQEDADFAIEVNVRAAERKLKDISLREQEIANRKLAYEEQIQEGKAKGLDAYEKELGFEKELLKAALDRIEAEKKAELAKGEIGESARITKEAEEKSKAAKLSSAKRTLELVAKERAAKADAAQRELEEARAIFDEKVRTGQFVANLAEEEKKIILQALEAKKKALKAHEAEAIASGQVTDEARLQRDTQIQINQAIRDAKQALNEVNDKYKSGDSFLDKAVKKYDKILAALNKIRGEEEAEKEAEENPEEEDSIFRTKEGDKFKRDGKKAELERKERIAKEEVARAEIKKKRDDDARAEAEIIASRSQELRKEGKSREEIIEIVKAEAAERKKNAEVQKEEVGTKEKANAAMEDAKAKDKLGYRDPSVFNKDKGKKPGETGGPPVGTKGQENKSGPATEETAQKILQAIIRATGQRVQNQGKVPGRKNSSQDLGSTLYGFPASDQFAMEPFGYPGLT